jgi:hypothetical protein
MGGGVHPRLRSGVVLAFLLTAAIGVGGYLTRQTWLALAAESLVCRPSEAPSDVIVVDFVENNYLLFQRAQHLQARHLASTVLVPIMVSENDQTGSSVAQGFVDVMCRVTHVSECTTFYAAVDEPISLNFALRTAAELQSRGVHSMLLVTSAFRSRRAATIYAEVLRPFGIAVHCQPVFSRATPANWTDTSHGIQDVVLQFGKLLYYRAIVMPRVQWSRLDVD